VAAPALDGIVGVEPENGSEELSVRRHVRGPEHTRRDAGRRTRNDRPVDLSATNEGMQWACQRHVVGLGARRVGSVFSFSVAHTDTRHWISGDRTTPAVSGSSNPSYPV
jgi:hypothetical protein